MPTEFNTVTPRIAIIRGLSEAKSEIKHVTRQASLSYYKEQNPDFYNPENERNNLYIDDDGKEISNKKLYLSTISKFESQVNELKKQHEFTNFGHYSVEIDKIKKQIIGSSFESAFKDNWSLKEELDKAKNHKEIISFLRKNKDIISFKFNTGKPPSKTVTWEEYLSGVSVKYDHLKKEWVRFQKQNNRGVNSKPAFLTNFQIHISREYFEQQNYVSYKKQKRVKFYNNNISIEDINTGIKEVLNPKFFKEWTLENQKLFKELLVKATGNKSLDNLLCVTLHMDESKPHIDILLSNIHTRERYYQKQLSTDGKTIINKPITKEVYEELKKEDDSIVNSYKKYGVISSYRDPNLNILLDSEKYADSLLTMHEEKFDPELKGRGFARAFYEENSVKYEKMDIYKKSTNNKLDFSSKENNILNNLNRIKDNTERNFLQQQQKSKNIKAMSDIFKEIYLKLSKNINADIILEKNRLIKEADITDPIFIRKAIEEIKNEILFNSKSKSKGR